MHRGIALVSITGDNASAFNMGDVLTLIEKAEQQFDQQKAQELAEKLKKNRFTLQDYYDQLVQVKGMGSVEELLGMMPGINAKALEGQPSMRRPSPAPRRSSSL